jgi:hypothetical protein
MSRKHRNKSKPHNSRDLARVSPLQYPAWHAPLSTSPPQEPVSNDTPKNEGRIHKFSWLITALIGAAVGVSGYYLTFRQNSVATTETNKIRVEELRKTNDLKRFELINQLISHLGHDTATTRRYTSEAIKQLGINPSEVRAPVRSVDPPPQPSGGAYGLFRDLEGHLWAGGSCAAGQQCAQITIQ